MNLLPHNLQALIIFNADVPIDTYLHYRKIGAEPKKLRAMNYEYLDKILIKRTFQYNKKKQLDKLNNNITTFLYYHDSDLEDNKSIQIAIDFVDNIVKMAIRISKTIDNGLYTQHKTVVNIHSGEKVEDWMNDSDDDL
jgi:hypothetical protein